MSRIGKKPVVVPEKVKVSVAGSTLQAEGPKGKLSLAFPAQLKVAFDAGKKEILVERGGNEKLSRALHGTFRALAANIIEGVLNGYERKLEIQGVGFKAAVKGSQIQLSVGYANVISVDFPAEVKVICADPTHISIQGPDKQKVGEVAARIRAVRPPDVYQGKGIRYAGEVVRKKVGKASFGGAAS